MAITINGTGTITGITAGGYPDATVTADDLAATLDLSGKTVTLPSGVGGKILQVVQGSTNTQVSVSTTTYTDTGLSASITPTSNTSKILVLVNQSIYVYQASASSYGGIRLYRDSTVIHTPVEVSDGSPYEFGSVAGGASSTALYTRANISFLDEPGSTSLLTYKTQGRPYSTSNGGKMNFNLDPGPGVNATSYIILVEIAA